MFKLTLRKLCWLVLLLLWSCAQPKQIKQPEPAALAAKVAELSEAARTTALVAYAFLYTEQAPTRFEALRRAKPQQERWPRLGRFTEFVSRPVESGLPMNIEELSAYTSEETAARLKEIKTVLLARYYGPKLAAEAHVIEFAKLARMCSGTPQFVLDLSTRRVYRIDEFDQSLKTSQGFLADQVVPGVERAQNGSITFYTRGMVKFGLPDLEQTDIEPKDAKQAFGVFQQTLLIALEQSTLQIGDRLNTSILVPCKRPKNAIEQSCVNLSPASPVKGEN